MRQGGADSNSMGPKKGKSKKGSAGDGKADDKARFPLEYLLGREVSCFFFGWSTCGNHTVLGIDNCSTSLVRANSSGTRE